MIVTSIIAAPHPKRAVMYDPDKDDLVFHVADIIGLISMEDLEEPDQFITIPMYMISDEFGGYNLPQMDARFIEFVDMNEDIDYGKYITQVEEIKKLIASIDAQTVQVETIGNVSRIKQFTRPTPKKDKPDYEN
jgi:hypothetical protein